MKSLVAVGLSAVFLFTIFSQGVVAQSKNAWKLKTTTSFEILSNGSETEIDQLADLLEAFDLTVRTTFTELPKKSTDRTRVIAGRGGVPVHANHSFGSNKDQSFLVIKLDDPGRNSIDSALNRYVHHLLENQFGLHKMPAWLIEGIATEFADFGKSTSNKLNSPQLKELIPQFSGVNTLLTTEHFTIRKQDAERVELFRLQSWLFLRFLAARIPKSQPVLSTLLADFANGERPAGLLSRRFGIEFVKIDTEFKDFIESYSQAEPVFTAANPPARETSLRSEVVSESQRLAFFGAFLYSEKQFSGASEYIEKSVSLDSESAETLSLLALIRAEKFYFEEASEMAAKAAGNEPLNPEFHYRLAVVLGKRGMTEYGFVSGYHPALANAMRESLKRAIELKPDFPEAMALLAFVNFIRNEDLEKSLDLVRRARASSPGNPRFLLREAEIELRRENFTSSRKITLEILRSAPDESLKLYAQNTLQRIDSTEFQLASIRNRSRKEAPNEIVTDKPLSEDEIAKLRAKAVREQIRGVLKKPGSGESRIFGTLARIECSQNSMSFLINSDGGQLRLSARSLDSIALTSFVEELSDYKLGCGPVSREHRASFIFQTDPAKQTPKTILSIEFVPPGFVL
jgi:tetratricopeptide (TPR) repeat protein